MYLTKKLLLCHIYHFNINNCTSFKSFFESLFDEQRNAEALALKETSTYFSTELSRLAATLNIISHNFLGLEELLLLEKAEGEETVK